MNHKHRTQRRRDIAWRIFLATAFISGVIYLCYNPEPAQAAYIPTCNATDAPILIVEKYLPAGTEVDMIAQTVWGEARGLNATEQAAVVWTILNRVDSPAWPDSITGVITQKNPIQFAGYKPSYPVTDDIRGLTIDVLSKWLFEKLGGENVGRILPAEYLYFTGDGSHNHFKKLDGTRWDWKLPSPYEN